MRYFNYILRTAGNPRILSLKDQSSFLGFFSQSRNPNPNTVIPNERSWNNRFASTSTEQQKPSERVSALVDEIRMGIGGKVGGVKGGASKGGEEKKAAEKTAFDFKLEGFDAAGKIKIIKEVRTFTDLGLKEAKELVEKAPTLLKKGVTKEEAVKIIEKMTAIGAKVTME
ncbi:hypothetical protein MKW94_022394 [Papaver nudicaule]|uniref:Large ribosomal subunit protein bL12 C-terminal domain-containing protein n=1 Tax=Papaver nudicaule TaxID=74823 RepID=A0AA41UYJ5_PAPNU|nr:hypothetical protein [Papaver nudicaule]